MHKQPEVKEVQNDQLLKSGLAAFSSLFAQTATYPMDHCKTRMQLQTPRADGSLKYRNFLHGLFKIGKQEGVGKKGLFKGVEASMANAISFSGVSLALYEPIKVAINQRTSGTEPNSQEPAWTKFAAGALSGIIAASLANPTDLVKTRMQAYPTWKPNKSVGSHTYDVYRKNGGLCGFWQGVNAAIARATIIQATYLGSYDIIKHYIINKNILENGLQSQVMAAAITGILISIVSSPIDNVKTKLMTSRQGTYNGIYDCASKMMKQYGLRGFYRGFLPQCLSFSPFVMIQIITFETLRKMSGLEGM